MKRIIIVLVLLALPMTMFAQFYLGPTAMYKGDPLDPPASVDYELVDHLAFGVDAKLKISIFEAQAMALYNLGNSFDTYLDAGVAFDLAIVTIGAGIGPNFIINLDEGVSDPVSFGFNAKIHADLNLGDIKISAYYMFLINDITVSDIESQMYAGNVGLSVLFKLL